MTAQIIHLRPPERRRHSSPEPPDDLHQQLVVDSFVMAAEAQQRALDACRRANESIIGAFLVGLAAGWATGLALLTAGLLFGSPR